MLPLSKIVKGSIIILLGLILTFNFPTFFGESGGKSNTSSSSSKNFENLTQSDNFEPANNELLKNIVETKLVANTRNDFTQNLGQVGTDEVKFYMEGKGVWITSKGIIIQFYEKIDEPIKPMDKYNIVNERNNAVIKNPKPRETQVVEFEFLNSNDVVPNGIGKQIHRSNYFFGCDPTKWQTDVPNYNEVYFENIYNQIDLRYYFENNGLKYDFIVHPGGDPAQIAIQIKGSKGLAIAPNGDLEIKTDFGDLKDKNLNIYQNTEENKIEVPGQFVLFDSDCYGFDISGSYDQNKSLVIDPLLYSTYFGGSSNEFAMDVIVDANDNLLISGYTDSTDFPIKDGLNQAPGLSYHNLFVLNLSSDGTTLHSSSYFGGSDNETNYAITLDSRGNIYLTGYTISSDFPTTFGAYDTILNTQDIYVVKLNSKGNNLLYSTFVGGWSQDFGLDLIVDDEGCAYVVGFTISSDFPTTPEAYDISYEDSMDTVIFALNENGTQMKYSTFFGGKSQLGGSYGDQGMAITFDSYSNVCIAGLTDSFDYPATNGSYDIEFNSNSFSAGFCAKLDHELSTLLYSTLFEGSNYDMITNVFIGSDNNTYVTGQTHSTDLPMTMDAYDSSFNGFTDGFVTGFNSSLSSLVYSTFIGGSQYDYVEGAAFTIDNNILIVGTTGSTDFPVTDGAFDTSLNGGYDLFIITMDLKAPSLIYSSYFGGILTEYTQCATFDYKGYIYMAGWTLGGFPTTSGSYNPNFSGGVYDGFALKFELNCTPAVVDLLISEPVVYRSTVIDLYSNASDFEDIEVRLLPEFEYKTPGSTEWSNKLLDTPVYINERWQTSFTIYSNASTGYYDFRVRFKDTDQLWSKWLYKNGSLKVLNNPPEIDYFNLSKYEAVISEKIELHVSGIDVEDNLQDFIFKPEYRHSTGEFWEPLDFTNQNLVNDKFVFTFSIGPGNPYGDYYFKVMCYDKDEGYSDWVILNESLLILPAPPEILSINTSREQIYRSDIVELYVNCTDPDSCYDEIYIELQYKFSSDINWQNIYADPVNNRWEALLKSKPDWHLGNYSFRTRALDMQENSCEWVYLNDTLFVLNNGPEALRIDNIPARTERGKMIKISIDSKDIEDTEKELIPELEYKLPGSTGWNTSYLSEPYYGDDTWIYEFNLSIFAPLGYYSFRGRVIDMDNNRSSYIYSNDSMVVYNMIPEISGFDQAPPEVFRTETISITAEGYDHDTLQKDLNCHIYYLEPDKTKWAAIPTQFNESSNKWNSELVTTKFFTIGNYSFKVFFEDPDGNFSKTWYYNQTVWVKNNLPEISPDLDDIKIGKTQYILKLTDYGFDVETSKNRLIWQLDESTVNNKLFHVETGNIGKHEIILYPVKSKEGRDDVSIILIDADNGRAVKKDLTIIVNSKSGGGSAPGEDDTTVDILTDGSNLWIYLIIPIIVVIIIISFIYFRRKKMKEPVDVKKDEAVEIHNLDEQPAEPEIPESEIESFQPETAVAEPLQVIEKPEIPLPLPAPATVEPPQLPAAAGCEKTKEESPDAEVLAIDEKPADEN